MDHSTLRNEGEYYARVDVIGSRCHGGNGGCCTLAEGDAYIVISYAEFHTPLDQPAYQELEEVGGKVRFGDILKRGCTLTSTSRKVNGSWVLTAVAKCPIFCGGSCLCESGSASLGVYSPDHKRVHPDPNQGGNDIPGLASYSMQFGATATLFDSKVPCTFGACSASLTASWDYVKLNTPGPGFPGGINCIEPKRKDFSTEAEFFRAYERYMICNGWMRNRKPWSGTNCNSSQFQRARNSLQGSL